MKKKIRKPKDISLEWVIAQVHAPWVTIETAESMTPKEARRLAAWLLKAAQYLENVSKQKEK